MDEELLEKAVRAAGGQVKVANACGVTQQTVSYWIRRAKKWPAEHVKTLAEKTGGEYTVHDIRPDIFGEDRAA